MGRLMVDRPVAAGHEVVGLGRTAEARKALASAGASLVAEANAVAEKADVVCVCVFSDEQVREVSSAGNRCPSRTLPSIRCDAGYVTAVTGWGRCSTWCR